jgi:hypothetical protein
VAYVRTDASPNEVLHSPLHPSLIVDVKRKPKNPDRHLTLGHLTLDAAAGIARSPSWTPTGLARAPEPLLG